MTESCGFLVDWSLEIKLLNDISWSEVEIILDDSNEIIIGESLLDCSVRVNVDGKWVGETDGIGDLNEASMGETVGNNGLGNISSIIGS